jgi:Transposase, Mutator family/Transposase IS116/IS110/IS902 family
VSTRRVDQLVESLGLPVSKSEVSRVCQALDEHVEAFRTRPLEGTCLYLFLDAKVEKVRDGGRVVNKALVIAHGVHESGRREILSIDVGEAETEAFWTDFLRGLVARGLVGVQLAISDAHAGLKTAIAKVLGCSWQRCTVVVVAMIDALEVQIAPITKQLRAYARRQVGCRALMAHYGIGELTAVTILAELGDCRRFSSSRHAVRFSGLDITVHQSDQRRAPGHLSRQGPPALRWALFEAAHVARRTGSPDREYHRQAAERLGANRACLAIARKLLKRSYHTLSELGEEALAPA